MSTFALEAIDARVRPVPIPLSDVDATLTAQLVVAWAGEGGEDPRLSWWPCDLVSEFGGEDLFARVLPNTAEWATLQAVREAARRRDAGLRRQDGDPDRVLTLYSLGFELDERIEERLQDLKRSGTPPHAALPGLAILREPWSADDFYAWARDHGTVDVTITPIGRRLPGPPPASLAQIVKKLVAALAPPANDYPLPHFRKS